MADHEFQVAYNLTELITADAALLPAEVRWPGGLPPPTHQLHWAAEASPNAALQNNDYLAMYLNWPLMPSYVALMVDLTVAATGLSQAAIRSMSAYVGFQEDSADRTSRHQLIAPAAINTSSSEPSPLKNPGDPEYWLAEWATQGHWLSDEANFRLLDRSRISVVTWEMNGTVTQQNSPNVQVRCTCLVWPVTVRKLGALRLPRLYT